MSFHDDRYFIQITFLTSAFFAFIIILFNWSVDSFNLFESPLIEGFNKIKVEALTPETIEFSLQQIRKDRDVWKHSILVQKS